MTSKKLPSVAGNLLVVDDAPSILIILKSFLEGDRCRLFPAENGAKAMEILETQQIDLVLLDIMMPEMGGYEVCRQMRANERTRDIPVIFLTGLGRKEEIVRGLEVGGSDYLIKPFDKEELILRVRHHLSAYSNQRRLQRMAHEQRLFNQALNEELKRQADVWAPLHQQIDGPSATNAIELKERLQGLQHFFENVRQWSDLLSGNQSTIRSMVNLKEEIVWSLWTDAFQSKSIRCEIDCPQENEVYADIRMLNLMFGLLFPWIMDMASPASCLTLQSMSGDESTDIKICWEATSEALDALPEVQDLDAIPSNGDIGTELPLRLTSMAMSRHFGELVLSRDASDAISLSLTFPNS